MHLEYFKIFSCVIKTSVQTSSLNYLFNSFAYNDIHVRVRTHAHRREFSHPPAAKTKKRPIKKKKKKKSLFASSSESCDDETDDSEIYVVKPKNSEFQLLSILTEVVHKDNLGLLFL